MPHLPHFITDLALILAVAGVTTLLFRKINQPVVLGYIIAGFLVGPHVSLIPTVIDGEAVRTWSEIGVIFLLFTLGLEFSFRKLAKAGGSVLVTAMVEVGIMFGLGYATGLWMGWHPMDSLFLGAILCISSTTIIVKAFDETGYRTKKFAALVLGVLIIQDLVAVLLMVLLSTVAVSNQFSGAELGIQILKLVFFLTLWFIAGIFFIPSVLKRAKPLLNDETLLVLSIALCLLMVLLAVKVGFSAALGAFIMGSILAETSQAERIEHLLRPVKNLFAAVFFVSVGMMIDPGTLREYAQPIFILTALVLIVMPLSTILGALVSGQSLRHAVQSGMTLSQIGEFSFIIASLGVTLGVTHDFLYPIAVAVSTITTFTTPFFMRKSTGLYERIERWLPESWVAGLNRYSTSSQQLAAYSAWKTLLRGYFINAAIHTIVSGAVILLVRGYVYPFMQQWTASDWAARLISVLLTLTLAGPFVWALSIRRVRREAYSELWLNRKLNRGPLVAIEIGRILLAIFIVAWLFYLYYSLSFAFAFGIIVTAASLALFNKRLQQFYNRIENRFLENLHEKELLRKKKTNITPWDAHLASFDVAPESTFAGIALEDLQWREQYGVNIALVERGDLSIISPDRHEKLFPGDRLSIIGTDEQLGKVREIFESRTNASEPVHDDEIALVHHTVGNHSRLHGQTIRKSGLRELAQAIVVGLERNGQRMLNPESSTVLQHGDILWVVGARRRIVQFFRQDEN
ncbi:MAG: cation:proton antiporter [Cyclobacteriaceae bacterium]